MLALAFFLTELSRYPILDPGVQAHYLSSYDRSGGEDDGFDGTYSALYVDAKGEQVIFDVKGPGTLYNLWFTSRRQRMEPSRDRSHPILLRRRSASPDRHGHRRVFSGRNPPFVPPHVYHAFQSTGGYVSALPFPFARRLKITTEKRVGFYNAYYHTYSPDCEVSSWTRESVSGPAPAPPQGALASGTVSLLAPAMPDGERVPSRSRRRSRGGMMRSS